MEAAMGGATFIDGDWESICGMLSIDQDSDFANLLGHNSDLELPRQDDHHDTEGLLSLLMGDSNPITSPYELSSLPFFTNQGLPNPISNIFPHMMSSSSTDDLSNNSSSSGSTKYFGNGPHHFVQPYSDDQLDFLADDSLLSNEDAPIIENAIKRTRDEIESQSEIPAPKRRSRVPKDAAKGKRKEQPRKGKLKEVAVLVKEEEEEEEEDRKSSYEISDNESNASQEPILNSNNGKKRANRGAATDPQSLYARKRRERINERLKVLQTLVPNGTKVDMSTMLEEAVNYVKFLQLQIKLLSSDEMWMYAPLAYNGFDVGHYNSF